MIPLGTRVRILPHQTIAIRLHEYEGIVTGERISLLDGELVEVTIDGEKDDKPWGITGHTWGLPEVALEQINAQ